MIERLAVSVMFLIILHFLRNLRPWTADLLTERLGTDPARIDETVEALRARSLIRQSNGDSPAYVPARDLDSLLLQNV